MNIIFLDSSSLGDTNLAPLNKLGNLTVYADTDTTEQLLERCRDAEIIICNKVKITAPIMDMLPRLQLVCISATGTNNVDLAHAERRGIAVRNVAGYSTASVAQVTFALLLALVHQLAYFDRYVKSGDYARSSLFTHYGRSFGELAGKQFGVVGMGNIGKRVASIAEAFGAQVLYYSTSGHNTSATYPCTPLYELLKMADVVSIHAPLNHNTYNLIAYEQLCMMKPSAFLVNTGRGKIVNEPDLARALDENRIAGAAIDVFEREPINADNPLLRIANPDKLIMTPHVGWLSVEARRTLVEKVTENIRVWQRENRGREAKIIATFAPQKKIR
jgi:glycerate dehydrogenase